jgi:hypothetical protein
MKPIVIDGAECDPIETACWAAAYGAACTGEILALRRAGNDFRFALDMLDGEAAALIADAAVLALRAVRAG